MSTTTARPPIGPVARAPPWVGKNTDVLSDAPWLSSTVAARSSSDAGLPSYGGAGSVKPSRGHGDVSHVVPNSSAGRASGAGSLPPQAAAARTEVQATKAAA